MTHAALQERKVSKTRAKSRLKWVVLILIGVGIVAGSYWRRNGGREDVILALQPGFEVIKLDGHTETMTVTRLGETYLVRCAEACNLFTLGRKYKLRNHSGALEVRRNGKTIKLPILQEHIEFETAPGGHG